MTEVNKDAGADQDKNKKEEKTIEQIQDENKGGKEGEQPKVVPEAVFLETKAGKKAAEARVKELEALIASGATAKEVSEDIEAAATELGVDKGALKKFADSIIKNVKESTAAEFRKEIEPLKAKDNEKKINEAFTEHFNAAMQNMPEFKEIVDPEVIKTLSLDPKNAKKTFSQIIEDTYGKAVPGKRTMTEKQPGSGREPEEVDVRKAQKDGEYFGDVLKDPKKKADYNKGLLDRIGKSL